MEDQPQSLYDKYGGQETVDKMTKMSHDLTMADETLRPFFDGVDEERLLAHESKFIAMALGGPNQYEGRSLREAHKRLALTDENFDRFVGHITDTMDAHGFTEDDIATVIEGIEQTRGEVLNR